MREFGKLFAGGGIPDSRGLVPTRRDNPRAVRTEGRHLDTGVMSQRLAQRFAGVGVPDLGMAARLVEGTARRDHARAIRAELRAVDGGVMLGCLADGDAGGDVPDLGKPLPLIIHVMLADTRDDPRSVRAEAYRVHGKIMLHGLANGLAGCDVPDAHKLVGIILGNTLIVRIARAAGGNDMLVVRAEIRAGEIGSMLKRLVQRCPRVGIPHLVVPALISKFQLRGACDDLCVFATETRTDNVVLIPTRFTGRCRSGSVPNSNRLVCAGRENLRAIRIETRAGDLVLMPERCPQQRAGRGIPDTCGIVHAGRHNPSPIGTEARAQDHRVVPERHE